jgi:7-alpha-hydroxysteroid dehydrogenase
MIRDKYAVTVMQDEQMHRDLPARIPMDRAGKPEDIACAAVPALKPRAMR